MILLLWQIDGARTQCCVNKIKLVFELGSRGFPGPGPPPCVLRGGRGCDPPSGVNPEGDTPSGAAMDSSPSARGSRGK